MKFTGIIPPIITPFHDDGSVDEAGYATLIEHMLDEGVEAIIAGGTTGEFYTLTREERVRQFAWAREVIDGRVPLIATEGACAYAVAAREAGADAMLVAAPYYSQPTAKELAAHCLAIDRAGKLPIMLYNYPGRTGASMSEEFLERVGQRANFASIKEASGDINRVHLIAREFPQIQLSCGADDQALEFFAWGATSWVTALANFFAGETVALYRACVIEKDFDKGRRLMSALLPLTTVLEHGGKFVQCAKFGCEYYGLPGGPVRRPLRPMKKELIYELRQVLDTAKAAIQNILSEDQNVEEREVGHVRVVN
jgi:4-hydroxy-tetrahydrodipicolinate synthase